MPSGRVLNSGGPPKIICDAIVPSPLEDEDDELPPHPLTPIVRAVATAASATSLVFMFSPVVVTCDVSGGARAGGSGGLRGELLGEHGRPRVGTLTVLATGATG